MDDISKGGRGKRAPYESTHYRLPVPIKSLAEEMATIYRELVIEYTNPQDPALIAAVRSAIAPGAEASTQINVEKAIAILHYATTLKANAGGAIKERIREALSYLL